MTRDRSEVGRLREGAKGNSLAVSADGRGRGGEEREAGDEAREARDYSIRKDCLAAKCSERGGTTLKLTQAHRAKSSRLLWSMTIDTWCITWMGWTVTVAFDLTALCSLV